MLFFILACLSEKQDSAHKTSFPKDPWVLEKTKQREGDAAVGYDYLLYGGYIGSGIPKEIFINFLGHHQTIYCKEKEVCKHSTSIQSL